MKRLDKSKSPKLALLLTFILGPLGLFYSATQAGIIFTAISLLTLTTVFGPIFCWLMSVAIGAHILEESVRYRY